MLKSLPCKAAIAACLARFRAGVVAPFWGLWLTRVNSLPRRSIVLRSNSRISLEDADKINMHAMRQSVRTYGNYENRTEFSSHFHVQSKFVNARARSPSREARALPGRYARLNWCS